MYKPTLSDRILKYIEIYMIVVCLLGAATCIAVLIQEVLK